MQKNKWIAHEKISDEAGVNLLCFIFDGGSASYFAPWKRKFNEDINLLPVLYPLREKRVNDPAYPGMDEFITDLVEELPEVFSGRYAFLGYCSGAVLGYEASLKAREIYGKEPEYGMVVSSDAPEFLREKVPEITEENSQDLFFGHMLSVPGIDEKPLKEEGFLKYYKPLFEADYSLLGSYKYKSAPPFLCDFDVITSPEDKEVSKEKIAVWKTLTKGEVRFKEVSGGHFLIEDKNNREMIIETLNKRLSSHDYKPKENSHKRGGQMEVIALSESERLIFDIWCDVFGTSEIGADDDFFAIGGDSLKGIEIITLLAQKTAVSFKITDIFEKPTIKKLAALLDKKKDDLNKTEANEDLEELEI